MTKKQVESLLGIPRKIDKYEYSESWTYQGVPDGLVDFYNAGAVSGLNEPEL